MMLMFITPSINLQEEIMAWMTYFCIAFFVILKSIQKTQISAHGEI